MGHVARLRQMRIVRMKRRFEILKGRCGNSIVLKNWKTREWVG
jgi:hypothetical protein